MAMKPRKLIMHLFLNKDKFTDITYTKFSNELTFKFKNELKPEQVESLRNWVQTMMNEEPERYTPHKEIVQLNHNRLNMILTRRYKKEKELIEKFARLDPDITAKDLEEVMEMLSFK